MGANATGPKYGWHERFVSVFNGDSSNPLAWTELDLSAFVGNRCVLILLSIMNLEVGTPSDAGYAVRPFGLNTDLPANFPVDAGGCYSCHIETQKKSLVMTRTDDDGKIDWYCNLVDHWTGMYLYGYCN